ncbi:MAG: hypothetical protein R2685_16295 [Candidatus Nitrosocosmicus sp.]|nr:hypothetical protein [Candidatus Nitrosocosmicus sp.]
MLGIDEHKNAYNNSGSDVAKPVVNDDNSNKVDVDEQYSKKKHNTTNPSNNIEHDLDKLLEPNPEFRRSDGSISSTTSRDLDYCINIALKEAVKEEKLVKQVVYTMLSAYTNNPINLSINAPPGEGKSYVLTTVGDLFPKANVIYIAGMSSKAIFHKDGYIAIRDEDGEYVEVEDELQQLKETIQDKKSELSRIKNDPTLTQLDKIAELDKEIDKDKQRIKYIEKNVVKVIDLSHKILVFLDTPSSEIFDALMSLLSHDMYEVEYQFVDSSNRTGLKTRTNVLRGWPSVIFAQAIDYTQYPRYQEIQRRFIIANPKMDVEKYQSAINHILEKKGSPDFVYQQKIVSDEDKDVAREIILNIKDDILSLSRSTKLGKNNTIVPFVHLIPRILSKNITAQDMTFTDRLMNVVGLVTSINHRKRPYMEIRPAFKNDSFRIPMTLYSDLAQALSLVNNFHGGIRPYVLEWYSKVFLELFNSKVQPNSKIDKVGSEIAEPRIAVTTTELIDKTKEAMSKSLTSKSLLQEFVYPLLNTGYIDSIQSELDKRAKIYFPTFNLSDNKDEEKNSNLFLFDKKNNLFDIFNLNNINIISNQDKNLITSKIEEVRRYSSEKGNLTTLKFADFDVDHSLEDNEEDKTVQQIVDKYYFEFFKDHSNVTDDVESKDSISKTASSEEYLQAAKNEDILHNNSTNYVKNNIIDSEPSNNLFLLPKKNKLIYSCYRCVFETGIQTDYESHCVRNHPGKPAYPSLADIEKDRLKSQGKSWE